MFVCCRREASDKGTEGVDPTETSYPASSPRPKDAGGEGGEHSLFGELKEPLQTGPEKSPDGSPLPPATDAGGARGLPVAFRDGTDGKERILTFVRTPFGLNFQPEMPIRITEVSGHAAELGVQPGWEIVTCGDVPLGSPNLRFADALEVLRVQADLLESRRAEAGVKSVSVAFQKMGGEVAMVNFTQAPLGIDFSPNVPLTVVAVAAGGSAAELGVQVGWEVKSIGGVDVVDPQLLLEDVLEVLKGEVGRLEGNGPATTAHDVLPVFFASGQEVTFIQAPLGFDVSPELPLKVADVKGQAAELGVLSGWVIQSIGGAKLDDPSVKFVDALAQVKSKVARFEARRRRSQLLRAEGLPLVFSTPGGFVSVVFQKTPLGMDLSECVPITVLKATGQASDLGVEEGWELLAAGGVGIADTAADSQSALAVLEAMVERLRVQMEARRTAGAAFDGA